MRVTARPSTWATMRISSGLAASTSETSLARYPNSSIRRRKVRSSDLRMSSALSSRMPLSTGKANCACAGGSRRTPRASISSTPDRKKTKATGFRSVTRTTRRSGQTRETAASATQSRASNRLRRSASGTLKMLWSKSAAKTRCTLEREAYFSPSTVRASFRSRDSVNSGSVFIKCRTLKPAMAVDTHTTPRPVSPATSRQLNRVVDFLDSRAMLAPGPRPLAPGPRSGLRSQSLQQLLAGLPYVARAQRQHQVSLRGDLEQRLYAGIDGAHIFHAPVAELADAFDQGLGGHAFDGLLRSRVNVHHKQTVGLVEGAGELVHQVISPGVAVRLEEHV